MRKRVRLTEEQMKKAINEISYGTLSDAESKSFYNFNDLCREYWRFHDKIDELESEFEEFEPNLYQNSNFNAFRPDKNNATINKIFSLMLKIKTQLSALRNTSETLNSILERKGKQMDNFQDAIRNIDNNPNLDWTENYDNKEIRDLQNY